MTAGPLAGILLPGYSRKQSTEGEVPRAKPRRAFFTVCCFKIATARRAVGSTELKHTSVVLERRFCLTFLDSSAGPPDAKACISAAFMGNWVVSSLRHPGSRRQQPPGCARRRN